MNLTTEQYEALVALSRRGATDQLELDAFLRDIEKANSITRYSAWVQWQEADSPLPPTTRFPENWPPAMRGRLDKINKPITRADVDALVASRSRSPVTVLVTKDPNASVGWTPVDQFFQ